jgi:RNA polymerase sigma factor (sigma-70 family)
MRRPSNTQIVGGFNRRESRAAEWILRDREREVAGIVRREVGDSPDTADLIAEVFAKLAAHTGRFRNMRQIRGYVSITANSLCAHYNERRVFMKAQSPGISHHLFSLTDLSREEKISNAYQMDLVYRAVEKLTGKTKKVFQIYIRDFPGDDVIADMLGMAEKTVANHRARALQILRMDIGNGRKLVTLAIIIIILLKLLYETL